MKRLGGFRRKTRRKFKKNIRTAGKISLRKYLQAFKIGDRVALSAEPAVQTGMYWPKYHGKCGKVIKKKGECYEVLIKDYNKEKIVIVHPVHLTRL